MSVSVARFKEEFPEFTKTSATLISRRMATAVKRTNVSIWGDLTDDGVMWLTAHLLSMSPSGEQSRLKVQNRGSTYELELKRMRREVTMGAGRVI